MRTLSTVLAAARQKISAANPAGRNTGAATPLSLGKEPGVDYSPKAGDERKFVAKHTHIEQEYPNGMEHAFTGSPVGYSMDKPEMKNFGNKEKAAIAANEEVESINEVSTKKLDSYRRKAWDQRSAGKSDSLKDKNRETGMQRSHDKLTGRAKVNATKEEVEPVDEVSAASIKKFKHGMAKAIEGNKEKPKEKEVKEADERDHKNPRGLTVNHHMSVLHSKIHGDFAHGPKEYNYHKTPSKADQTSSAAKAVADFKAKGGKVRRVREDFAGVPGPVDVNKKAVPAECTCPAKECPLHTSKLKAKTNMTKEETLHEISKELARRYVKAARKDNTKTAIAHRKTKIGGDEYNKTARKWSKREDSIERAEKKTTNEDANPNVQAIQTSGPAKTIPPVTLASNNKDLKNKGKTITVSNAAVKEEDITEISKKTLGSYIKKAHNQGANARSRGDQSYRDGNTERAKKNDKQDDKRSKGISRAVSRLTKEELTQEQIDAVLASEGNWIAGAIKHPGAEKRAASKAGESTHSYEEKHKHDSGKSGDRARLGLTLGKMHHKEEAEPIDELSDTTKKSYADKATGDIQKKFVKDNKYTDTKQFKKRAAGINKAKGVGKDVDEETAPLIEGNSKEGYIARGKSNFHGEMTRWHNDHVSDYAGMGNTDRAAWHEKAADCHDEAARHYGHAAHFHAQGRKDKAYTHESAANGWAYQADDHERNHKLVKPAHEMAEEHELIEAAVLCDKGSLRKKMKYHKGKMKAEDIGSPKFKHHQRQIHTIKGMLEETDEPEVLDEKKIDDGFEYQMNKRGFMVKKRKYRYKDPMLKKEEVEADPQVERIKLFMDKEQF